MNKFSISPLTTLKAGVLIVSSLTASSAFAFDVHVGNGSVVMPGVNVSPGHVSVSGVEVSPGSVNVNQGKARVHVNRGVNQGQVTINQRRMPVANFSTGSVYVDMDDMDMDMDD